MSTFILELLLKTTPRHEKKILSRLEAARQVHNAVLGEGLKRLQLLKESKLYNHALAMPRGRTGDNATRMQKRQYDARVAAFKKAERAVGLSKYDLMSWATQFTHSWIRDHLGSQEVKAIVMRVSTSIDRYRFGISKPCKQGRQCTHKIRRCDLCGKPKFKRHGQVHSVENITNLQGLRWRGNHVQWRDLVIPAIIDSNNPVHAHGLSHRVKYVRILLKVISGRNQFYAQLVLDGKPLQQHPTIDGAVVGLDIGPSTIAVVSENDAFLTAFCTELDDISKEMRVLQRKIDRQRRANNPDCYDEKGRVIKGKRPRNKSNRMLETEVKLVELQRKQAEYRKSLHGQLANRVLEMGNVVRTEKVSYLAWQRMYGKSVGKRAPGMFVQKLRYKSKVAGGGLEEFSTYNTRLSQTCHCGKVEKKPLSQRHHRCECGVEAQRDLYSAFLARCVENDILNADQVKEFWSSAGPLLQAAFREAKSANGGRKPSSFG